MSWQTAQVPSILRLGPGLISISPLNHIKKMLHSHLIVHKCIHVTQNITKADNVTPFSTLGFKKKDDQ